MKPLNFSCLTISPLSRKLHVLDGLPSNDTEHTISYPTSIQNFMLAVSEIELHVFFHKGTFKYMTLKHT